MSAPTRDCYSVMICRIRKIHRLRKQLGPTLRDPWIGQIHRLRPTFMPVSWIEFTHKSSLYWQIIGLGTRTWSVPVRCRDPAGQSEFFVRVLRLKTFNWMYCYREFIVGIVVSAIAVFRLVDYILSSSLQIVHWTIYKLDSLANSTRDTGTMKTFKYWLFWSLKGLHDVPGGSHWLRM